MGSSPSKVETTVEGLKEKKTDLSTSEDKDDDSSLEEKKMETIPTYSATRSRSKGKSFDMTIQEDRQRREDRDDAPRRSRNDEQVHVNLAMADLMAYLQVVANNSNNLPVTRRDDPELPRMESNLTSEEYARKSAAFIPADVRVIGGAFTKYGRVWDLPTVQEYNMQDGAQEPGRSYGGACCNSLLKVLYDAANEAQEVANDTGMSNNLFDEDEDDEVTMSGMSFNRNNSFASLEINNHGCHASTVSWASLLRRMKNEMKDIEFAQLPILSGTRKIDLNQPFSLVPDSFDPKKGKKRSLLIGCNYTHINGAQLKASHDDVRSMKDYIVNVHGFPESSDMMTVLLDDDDHKHPTFFNITEAFKSLSEQSQPGDAVFIQFAGHGGRVLESNDGEDVTTYDEAIVPSDYTHDGLIRDTLIFKSLLAPMRYGVTVTVVIDACDTGMVLDLPYAWSTKGDRSSSTAKMSQNENFSFVRFLKVVKTLYESSTFTQLGRTVGSALTSGNSARNVDTHEEEPKKVPTESDAIAETEETNEIREELKVQTSGGGFLGFLCGTPTPDILEEEKRNRRSSRSGDEIMSYDFKNPSILDQMINCTLGHEVDELDDMSFQESYIRSQSTEEQTANGKEESSSCESTDDEQYKAKRRSRRHRGGRRRRK